MGPSARGTSQLGPGAVVLVPFPFTDLSGTKRRPGLVVSPASFHPEDLIVCAISSQVPPTLSRREVALEAPDLVGAPLPKPSVIRLSKLFTMHRGLVIGQFGRVRAPKLVEVLARLRELFRER